MSQTNRISGRYGAMQFATTRWSVVLSAGRDSSPDSQRALGSLCETYWYPLYAYVRRRVPDVNEAQDLTQAFFVELLEKNYVGSATPEQIYDRQWAIALLQQVMDRLADEFERRDKGRLFEELKGFLVGDHVGTTYSDVAERLNVTEAAAKKAASRMRRRYRELLREEIAQTVSGPDEIEDELRNLFANLGL